MRTPILKPILRQQGFTYLGLIILVAIIGMVGAAGLKVGSLLQRAQAEEELLEIGAEFSRALKSYADATPRGHPPFPATLEELLRDPRVPGVRRHLRKIYVDPMTGKAQWGLVKIGDTGVLGVYSLSTVKPLKLANFDSRFSGFDNKEKISDWKFMLPGQVMAPGGQGQAGTSQRGALPSLFGAAGGARPGAPAQPAAPSPAPTPSPAPAAVPATPPQAPRPAEPEPQPAPERTDAGGDKDKEDKEEEKGENDKEEGEGAAPNDSGAVRGDRAR